MSRQEVGQPCLPHGEGWLFVLMVTFVLISEKVTDSSIHRYSLSAYCMPAAVLGTGEQW